MSVWLPECPNGYVRDMDREDIILCVRGRDEMVKVGDFWVDRYEASVWADADCTSGVEDRVPYGSDAENYPETFPDSGSFTEPLYACSVRGVTPSRNLTWFQAQAACSASGKSLITNAEWQAAAAGTYDPPLPPRSGECHIMGGAPRRAGNGTLCVSVWGTEDMIGNVGEWTSDWWQAGVDWLEGGDGRYAEAWPEGYRVDNADTTWNLDGRAMVITSDFTNGLPAAAVRGGTMGQRAQAGAFALSVSLAPSNLDREIGFRCAIH